MIATICAVIAAFDEAPSVARVVKETSQYVSEVIVVDDGSRDGTAEIARAAGATVLRHDHNLGKGRAVRTGLEYALSRPHSHVLFIDADLQHDPMEIPKLIGCAENGAGEFVIGERGFSKDTMPIARYYTNVISSAIITWFIGLQITDGQSGFRLIRSDLLRRLWLTATRYEIETEILLKLKRTGATIDRVRVERLQYEGARSNFRPVRDTVRTFVLAFRYYYLPMRSAAAAHVTVPPIEEPT